jgi:hypothetical protein
MLENKHSYIKNFTTESSLCADEVITKDSLVFQEDVVIDTGCSISCLINYDYWNFNENYFEKYPNNTVLKYLYPETRILEWEKRRKVCVQIMCTTANGPTIEHKLLFSPPLFIKLENLQPVPITEFIIPLVKPNKKPTFLLGLNY